MIYESDEEPTSLQRRVQAELRQHTFDVADQSKLDEPAKRKTEQVPAWVWVIAICLVLAICAFAFLN